MFKKAADFIKDIFAPHAYGLMVVNCDYFRPMTGRLHDRELCTMSDDKYLEFCEACRRF